MLIISNLCEIFRYATVMITFFAKIKFEWNSENYAITISLGSHQILFNIECNMKLFSIYTFEITCQATKIHAFSLLNTIFCHSYNKSQF